MDKNDAEQITNIISTYLGYVAAHETADWPVILRAFVGADMPESMLPVSRDTAIRAITIVSDEESNKNIRANLETIIFILKTSYISDADFVRNLKKAKQNLHSYRQNTTRLSKDRKDADKALKKIDELFNRFATDETRHLFY